MPTQLALIGAQGILDLDDLEDLKAGEARVLELMLDHKWHDSFEICAVARGTEGLRRCRELRKLGYVIEKRKKTKRLFEYRIIGGI